MRDLSVWDGKGNRMYMRASELVLVSSDSAKFQGGGWVPAEQRRRGMVAYDSANVVSRDSANGIVGGVGMRANTAGVTGSMAGL